MRVGCSCFDKAPTLFPSGLGEATEPVQVADPVPVDYGYGPGKVGDLAIFLSILSSISLLIQGSR